MPNKPSSFIKPCKTSWNGRYRPNRPGVDHSRADAEHPNMGLQTWKNAPDGKILKSDVLSVAKNYLHEKVIKEPERIVSMYLDYTENQAARQIPMKMVNWIQKLDAFLQFNDYEILQDAGKNQSYRCGKAGASRIRKISHCSGSQLRERFR